MEKEAQSSTITAKIISISKFGMAMLEFSSRMDSLEMEDLNTTNMDIYIQAADSSEV